MATAKTEYFSIIVPNKVGQGAHVLSAFKEAGINFVGIWGYPGKSKKEARIDLIPEDAGAFKKAAKKLKIDAEGKQFAFVTNGPDQPGADRGDSYETLEGGISVRAVQAVCGGEGRFGAFVEVDQDDVKQATKAAQVICKFG